MSFTQMTLYGAVMILITAAIRLAAINKLPKRAFLALWGAAVLRLLVPISLPSALSAYSLTGPRLAEAVKTRLAAPPPSVPVRDAVPTSDIPAPWLTAPIPNEASVYSLSVGTILLVLGAFLCFAFFAWSYLKLREKFSGSLPVGNSFAKTWLSAHAISRPIEIRQSDEIDAPLTYGILRPVILMPKRTDWEDETALQYVLAHEYVHIRRFDAVFKLLLTSALCVHWFNPAVWLMYVLANRDIELACDEAVLRSFGESSRSGYALTLINMEEAKSGLTPLYNHFSREASEERIIAIMKFKKTSIAAITAAVMLVVGVTAAFATSAPEGGMDKSIEDRDRAANAAADNIYEGGSMMSYYNPEDGKTYYSWDEGKNWTPLTDEEYEAMYPTSNVVWWTAEEYADWLENEKIDLQEMIGDKGWTPSTGWFTWTQEKVDETIALYEGILEEIKSGVKVSKTVNGSEDTMLCMGTEDIYSSTDADLYAEYNAEREASLDETIKDYAPFGLTYVYDEKTDEARYYYEGKQVRSISDPVRQIWITEHTGNSTFPEDAIDLYAVYEGNRLVGLRPATKEESAEWDDIRSSHSLWYQEWLEYDPNYFEEFKPFGLTYDEKEDLMYFNGEPVRYFTDSAEVDSGLEVTRYEFYNEKGTVDLYTVRARKDNGDGSWDPFGKLLEIKKFDFSVNVEPGRPEAVTEQGGGSTEPGVSFGDRFARYKAFGITYEEAPGKSGRGNVYLNGKLVATFADESPNGVFTFQSSKPGGRNAYVEYDAKGNMTGVYFDG